MNKSCRKSRAVWVAIGLFSFISPVSSASPGDFWKLQSPMIKAQEPGAQVGVVESNIYILGGIDKYCCYQMGTNVVQEYSPVNDRWSQKSPMPTTRFHAVAGSVAGKIYVIGGNTNEGTRLTDVVEAYDPKLDRWSTGLARSPSKRAAAAGAVVNGRIYIMGGCEENNCSRNNTVEEYDPSTDSWRTNLALIPTGRLYARAVTIDNKIYLIGGTTETSLNVPVERYDPASDSWEAVGPPLLSPRYLFGVAVANSKIYVFGGDPDITTTEEFDPATREWTERAPMPVDAFNPAGASVGDKIYAIGGKFENGGNGPINTLQVYTPTNPSLPFSGFAPRAEFTLGPKANDDSYWVRGWLKLADTSNGIDPLTEAVTVKVGPFSHTLPAGSFTREGDSYVFKGALGASVLDVRITGSSTPGGYSFKSCLKKAELKATTLEPEVQLTIGDDSGQTILDVGYAKFGKGSSGKDWVFPPAR